MPTVDLAPAAHRRVAWLELFFDLVFVASVLQVAAPLAEHYSFEGLLRFSVLFILIWWAWLGQTMFATRFDRDDGVQRGLTLLQMFLVAVMAINATEALDSRESAGFAAAYGVLRLSLAAQYAREHRHGWTRPVTTPYLAGCSVAAVLWLVSALVPAPSRFGLWTLAFVVDAVTPIVAERRSLRLPPSPTHLPERFGLFTLILLGESVLALVKGMRSQEIWTAPAAVAAFAGLALLFLLWWWYFDGIGAAADRIVRAGTEARALRAWTYAHVPLYLGITVTGVGIERVIAMASAGGLSRADVMMLSGALAGVVLALTAIGHATPSGSERTRRLWVALGTAVIVFALGAAGVLIAPAILVLVLLAGVAAQPALPRARWPRFDVSMPQPSR
jgi:low temperature requirement protein LtrA